MGLPRRRTVEEEERAKNLKLVLYLQDSVYYHPQWNPTGAPPPGKPSMYKSSIRPIVPLEEGFECILGVVLVYFRCVWCCFNADLVNLSCFEVT
ncbi:hypothetical protein LXL04_012471 [Taraxacum kok-saghyz]